MTTKIKANKTWADGTRIPQIKSMKQLKEIIGKLGGNSYVSRFPEEGFTLAHIDGYPGPIEITEEEDVLSFMSWHLFNAGVDIR